MKINMFYNWPPSQDFVRVSFGMENIEDPKYEFRVLFKDLKENKVFELGHGWMKSEELKNIKHDFSRYSEIAVDRRLKEENNEERVVQINLDEKWPSEAEGESSTATGYWF